MATPRHPAALAALLAAGMLPARAEAFGPFEPLRSLPDTLRGTVEAPVAGGGPGAEPVDTLRAVFPALAACWEAPAGTAKFERTEITVRLSLRRDGSLIGEPRITFARTPGDARAREVLTQATLAAIRRCTPVRLTPALGAAIAGRPLALRFIYDGPKGQGI